MKSVCILLQSHYETDLRARRKAEALVAAGWVVDVFALRSPYSKGAQYTLDGVTLYTIALGKNRGSLIRYLYEYITFFIWAFFKVARLMGSRRYTVIDANNLPDFLVFAGAFGRWRGAKLVLDMHEITPEFFISKYRMNPRSPVVRILELIEQASLRYADRVININHPIEDVLVSRGMPREKSVIVMNAVDEEFFSAAARSGESPMAAPAAPSFVMMYHGTLTPLYGLDIAVEAFAKVQDRMPGAELWIIGTGTERKPLEEQARVLGLGSRVRFIGRVLPQEIPHWVRQCDVGVLPTRQDVFLDLSFSSKLSEYIIMGKAVIASRLKTINHYFTDRALAFFQPNTPDDLAARMLELYGDHARRAALATEARKELTPIRWEVSKDRYLKLMDVLCGASSPQWSQPGAEPMAQGASRGSR